MTREEAITNYIVPAIKRTWNDKKCKKILEALEQEPKTDVLDKIRAEIDAHREELKTMTDDDWYAGKLRGHDCDIEIIDKYKADVEPQERSDKGDIGTHYHCDRCGKSINHYGLCEECDKWLEDNYGEMRDKE